MVDKIKLKPILDGNAWLIGANPGLGALQGDRVDKNGRPILQECVDHHIFKADDGRWHLWGCIRGTKIGRLLYHWRAASLEQSNWEQTGEIIRCDRHSGESVNDWNAEEWIQSPYVVADDGVYYMLYGGHASGQTPDDSVMVSPTRPFIDCQICLMTSPDGINWQRRKNPDGASALFVGPGEARDPCVIRIDGIWHVYYTGHQIVGGRVVPAIFVRRSADLLDWSEPVAVHCDISGAFGDGLWNTECPHVVLRGGYFYLFRTQHYASAKTHVFRSENPYDFGRSGAQSHYVCSIAVAAPEIIIGDDGMEYISSNDDLSGGTKLCRLKWVKDS